MTSTRRRPTRLAVLALGLLIAAGCGIAFPATAAAHDVLISSSPAEGTTLNSAPTAVSFTFDQPVQNFDPVVSLIGPDGRQYATGTPQISGNVVTGKVGPLPSGPYIAAYRIVSADGHPVTGEVHFTLAAGASGASLPGAIGSGASALVTSGGPHPVASAPAHAEGGSIAAAASAATSTGKSAGLSTGIWIALIAAGLVIAAAAVVLLRRPSGGDY